MNSNLQRLLDEEDVRRHEIEVELLSKLRNAVRHLKHRLASSEKKHGAVLQRTRADERRAERTLRRRVFSLENEEIQKRAIIEEHCSLLTEAILRALEKDILTDVCDEAYNAHQRQKYFQKTVEVVWKREASQRRDIIGSERYERLLLRQRGDAQASKMLIKERLNSIRQKQRESIAFVQNGHRGSQITRVDAENGINGHIHVSYKTEDYLPDDYFHRAKSALATKEEEMRASIEHQMTIDRDVISRTLSYVLESRRSEEEGEQRALSEETMRCQQRHLKELEREALRILTATASEEIASRFAIERRFHRFLVQSNRRDESESMRHLTHNRKMEMRRERVIITRSRLEDPEPEITDLDGRLHYLPAAKASPFESRLAHATRQSTTVLLRSLESAEKCERVVIEKNERLERFAIVKDGRVAADRNVSARTKREKLNATRSQTTERWMLDHQQRAVVIISEHDHARAFLRATKALHMQEHAYRTSISAQFMQFFDEIKRYADATVGARSRAALNLLFEDEMNMRRALTAAESRNRAVLIQIQKDHKPQSRLIVVVPLPPPKSMRDFLPPPFLRHVHEHKQSPLSQHMTESTHAVLQT